MTESQKETIKFYTTNDYLLINGLLWKESSETIDAFIKLINDDGRGVIQEALELTPEIRWNCSKEEGEVLLKMYQRRFPLIENEYIKKEIIERAKQDIKNMMDILQPLNKDMVLYRNINKKYSIKMEEGKIINYLGFSSCSLVPHISKDAMYGVTNSTLLEIIVPKGTPVIRLDQMTDIQNEEDEVIISPITFLVTKVDNKNNKIYLTCINEVD